MNFRWYTGLVVSLVLAVSSVANGQSYRIIDFASQAGDPTAKFIPLRVLNDSTVVGGLAAGNGLFLSAQWKPATDQSGAQFTASSIFKGDIEPVAIGPVRWGFSQVEKDDAGQQVLRAYAWMVDSPIDDQLTLPFGVANGDPLGASILGNLVGRAESQTASDSFGNPRELGVVWSSSGDSLVLTAPGDFSHVEFTAMNSRGDVVANAFDLGGARAGWLTSSELRSREAAYMWRTSGWVRLESALVGVEGWTILRANYIDEAGRICATARRPDGSIAGVMLEPTLADKTGEGAVDLQDAMRFADSFFVGQTIADANGDGVIDGYDVTVFVTQYVNGQSKPDSSMPSECETAQAKTAAGDEPTEAQQCAICKTWNRSHPGQFHKACNPHCYGCNGGDPSNPAKPEGAPGFPGDDPYNPNFPHGGKGGDGAPGHDGGAGGKGRDGDDLGGPGKGGDGGKGGGRAPGIEPGRGGTGGDGGSGKSPSGSGSTGGKGGQGGDDGGTGGQGGTGGAGGSPSGSGGVGGDGGKGGTGGGMGGTGGDGGGGGPDGGSGQRGVAKAGPEATAHLQRRPAVAATGEVVAMRMEAMELVARVAKVGPGVLVQMETVRAETVERAELARAPVAAATAELGVVAEAVKAETVETVVRVEPVAIVAAEGDLLVTEGLVATARTEGAPDLAAEGVKDKAVVKVETEEQADPVVARFQTDSPEETAVEVAMLREEVCLDQEETAVPAIQPEVMALPVKSSRNQMGMISRSTTAI